MRTTKTRHEELGDLEGDILADVGGVRKKVSTEQIDNRLSNLKLYHTAHVEHARVYLLCFSYLPLDSVDGSVTDSVNDLVYYPVLFHSLLMYI